MPAILRNTPRPAAILEYRPVLRTLLLKLLQELVGLSMALKFPGFLQTATTIFLQATLFSQSEIADLGRQGAILCQHILHPVLPAQPAPASIVGDTESLLEGANGVLQTDKVEEAADESAPSSSDDEEEEAKNERASLTKSKSGSGASVIDPSVTPSAIPHIPAEAVPSASALEVDADDTISGPQPAHPDEEAESAGNESNTSKKSSATKRKHTRRYSNDVHPPIQADTGRAKRARRSEPSSKDTKGKGSDVSENGPLTVKPHDGNKRSKPESDSAAKSSTSDSKDASERPSSAGESLRVLPYPQSEANKPRKPLTSSQERRRKSTSGSPANRRTSGSPEGGNSLLTADTEMMPAPSAGDFFKDTSPEEVAPKRQIEIDPAIMGLSQAETSLVDPNKDQRAFPDPQEGNKQSAVDDSDDDGPIPQIVDSEEEEDDESDS